jgi:patatin-related protein
MCNQSDSRKKETRLAIVMYGGVSLAIYMYGVTKELLKLVQATTPGRSGAPQGTEKIYQELGEELDTRFVIDILSGASAGGLNAIVLAKALANNQSIDSLGKLWVSEGDISKLINDKESASEDELKWTRQKRPVSLLNSQRMYCKVLEALEEMEPAPGPSSLLPDGEELDLYVTTTDIKGLNQPIALANHKSVHERRYRQVFHFHYPDQPTGGGNTSAQINSGNPPFTKCNNPFLAFVGRCTSAFPVAFEPMQLRDVEEAFKHHPSLGLEFSKMKEEWRKKNYYCKYPGDDFEDRSFGDGGYLDNKPFSFILETVQRRRSDHIVDRKLIYIEPDPEVIRNDDGKKNKKPNALQNLIAAATGIPRYETIREDLALINERNKIIKQVSDIIKPEIQNAWWKTEASKKGVQVTRWTWSHEWGDRPLDEMAENYGPAYVSHHSLVINIMTNNLAETISRVLNISSEQEKDKIYEKVKEWRKCHYAPNREAKKSPENQFMYEYGHSYRLRRLNFLNRRINELYQLDDKELKKEIESILTQRKYNQDAYRQQYDLLQKNIECKLKDCCQKQFPNKGQLEIIAKNLSDKGLIDQTLFDEIKELLDQRSIDQTLFDEIKELLDQHPVDQKRFNKINELLERLNILSILNENNELLQVYSSNMDDNLKESIDILHDIVYEIQPLINNLNQWWRLKEIINKYPDWNDSDRKDLKGIRESLLEMKQEFRKIYNDLRNVGRKLRASEQSTEELYGAYYEKINQWRLVEEGEKAAEYLQSYFKSLKCILRKAFTEASNACYDLLGLPPKRPNDLPQSPFQTQSNGTKKIVQLCLQHYYQHYAHYDMLILSLLHGTSVGEEASQVDIFRISPRDRTAKDRKKIELAGVSYGHFGAFLSEAWRRNDILWGQWDAAETLIRSLMTNIPNVSEICIDERVKLAHEAIWDEARKARTENIENELTELIEVFRESENQQKRQAAQQSWLDKIAQPFVRRLGSVILGDQYDLKIEDVIEIRDSISKLKDPSTLNPDVSPLSPEYTLKNLARGTRVTGKLLENLAVDYDAKGGLGKYASWLATFGQIWTQLVEAAIPGSLWNLILKPWVIMFFIATIILIVLGYIFQLSQMKNLGFMALVLFFAFNLIFQRLQIYMRYSSWAKLYKIILVFYVILGPIILISSLVLNMISWEWFILLIGLGLFILILPPIIYLIKPVYKWVIEGVRYFSNLFPWSKASRLSKKYKFDQRIRNDEKSANWIVQQFHEGDLKCPHCGVPFQYCKTFQHIRGNKIICGGCHQEYNLYTNTVLEKYEKLTPMQVIMFIHGGLKIASALELDKEEAKQLRDSLLKNHTKNKRQEPNVSASSK